MPDGTEEGGLPGRLRGKVALVTGASRGIGRAIALRFAAEGARVAVAARTRSDLETVARECGSGTIAIPLDLSDEQACEEGVRLAEAQLGAVDVLVNSAGIAVSRKFTDTDTELWQRIMAVDLDGPFWLVRASLGGMLERGSGAVIMVASIGSRVGLPYLTAYNAAKHGLLGLTRGLAAEYPRSGVTFNCVCPFFTDTPMTTAAVADIVARTGRTREETLARLASPQGRLVRPEEVAAVCVLLASDEGRGINGQAINVDGGFLQS